MKASLDEIVSQLRAIIPPDAWVGALSSLGRSIQLAHVYGSDRWGLSTTAGVMLKVGLHEVFQLWRRRAGFQLIVDRTLVPAALRGERDLRFTGSEGHGGLPAQPGYYASNPGTEAVRGDVAHLEAALVIAAPAPLETKERVLLTYVRGQLRLDLRYLPLVTGYDCMDYEGPERS